MHRVQVMNDHDGWTVGHGLGLQLLRSGDRVFFGHGGAMPGFLAMLLGRRKEGVGAAVLTNASTPSAAVEKVCLDLAEKALELYEAEPEPWRARAGAAARDRGAPRHVVGGRDAVRVLVGAGPPARPPRGERPAAACLDLRGRRRRPVPRRRGPRARRAPACRAGRGRVDREAVLGDLPGHAGSPRRSSSGPRPCRRSAPRRRRRR